MLSSLVHALVGLDLVPTPEIGMRLALQGAAAFGAWAAFMLIAPPARHATHVITPRSKVSFPLGWRDPQSCVAG